MANGAKVVINLATGLEDPERVTVAFLEVLDALTITPNSVCEAASAVPANPSYRRNAERVRDEIAAMPSPARAVMLLERLATERAPLLRLARSRSDF